MSEFDYTQEALRDFDYTYERLGDFEYITQLETPALEKMARSYPNDLAVLLRTLIQKVRFLYSISIEGEQ